MVMMAKMELKTLHLTMIRSAILDKTQQEGTMEMWKYFCEKYWFRTVLYATWLLVQIA